MTPDTPEPAAMREDYRIAGLRRADLAPTWVLQFARWFGDAAAAGLPEPNAMIVATADPDARPSARTVLLKGYDERGFVFYTNLGSRKGTEATANPQAGLVFPWFAMQRQVVVCGTVEPVDRAETRAYFATRPRGSRLGAWASPQSQPIADRAALELAYEAAAEQFGDEEIPPPPHWGGLRVVPVTVEFWQGRSSRLHDRLRYVCDAGNWSVERLAP